ncbi:MAG: PEP-CTERM sorting domain-containing protein [Planctomycetota bacterium]
MKRLGRILLTVAFVTVVCNSAFALKVGFNPNIHNNTGQPAYDFHWEGIVKSSTVPVQVATACFVITPIPGFDWTYSGSTFVEIAPDEYLYSGGWSGNVPVPHCSTIHVGKYFDVGCHNTFMDIRGWWTDASGAKLNPSAGNEEPPGSGTYVSDVPLIGFEVQDHILGPPGPQTVTIQNATTEEILVRDYEAALAPRGLELMDLNEGDPDLDALTWNMLQATPITLTPGMTATFDLNAAGVTMGPGSFLVLRGQGAPPGGVYSFFAHYHEAHVPEPGGFAMVGLGLLAALRRRRT